MYQMDIQKDEVRQQLAVWRINWVDISEKSVKNQKSASDLQDSPRGTWFGAYFLVPGSSR